MKQMRAVTLRIVERLDTDQLDRHAYPKMNSIASLLRHIACFTESTRLAIFESRRFNATELEYWSGALPNLPLKSPGGYPLSYYTTLLAETSSRLHGQVSERSDDWLLAPRGDSHTQNWNYYFKLFHLVEDEISHRGQIKLAIRLMRSLA